VAPSRGLIVVCDAWVLAEADAKEIVLADGELAGFAFVARMKSRRWSRRYLRGGSRRAWTRRWRTRSQRWRTGVPAREGEARDRSE
jgi:hypothetical protein